MNIYIVNTTDTIKLNITEDNSEPLTDQNLEMINFVISLSEKLLKENKSLDNSLQMVLDALFNSLTAPIDKAIISSNQKLISQWQGLGKLVDACDQTNSPLKHTLIALLKKLVSHREASLQLANHEALLKYVCKTLSNSDPSDQSSCLAILRAIAVNNSYACRTIFSHTTGLTQTIIQLISHDNDQTKIHAIQLLADIKSMCDLSYDLPMIIIRSNQNLLQRLLLLSESSNSDLQHQSLIFLNQLATDLQCRRQIKSLTEDPDSITNLFARPKELKSLQRQLIEKLSDTQSSQKPDAVNDHSVGMFSHGDKRSSMTHVDIRSYKRTKANY